MFKKGKLYKVVKDPYPGCIGCILRYVGTSNAGHIGVVIKTKEDCKSGVDCSMFQCMIDKPNEYKMIKHESMVEFCKKLKAKREKE